MDKLGDKSVVREREREGGSLVKWEGYFRHKRRVLANVDRKNFRRFSCENNKKIWVTFVNFPCLFEL